MGTFLDLVHEDLLNSAPVVLRYELREYLPRLACMFQTLIVIIDKKDKFVLVIDNAILVVYHLDSLKLLKDGSGQGFLEVVELLSYAL